MRYHLDSHTLFIRGSFRAASTGIDGGVRCVSTLLAHTIKANGEMHDPQKVLENVSAGAGIGGDYFGFLTQVAGNKACVLQYDFVTVFIITGIEGKSHGSAGPIHIIVSSSEGMSDASLLETIMVATEAKTEALLGLGLTLSVTSTDGVIAASEGEERHRVAGRLTDAGKRVREAVLHGIPKALARNESGGGADRPAFFIFSRMKGDHWITWSPDRCPYYPCHFEGQSCEFCYCPFYPCMNEKLGQWAESSSSGRVWNCAGCILLHDPSVADYLKKYPGASQDELVHQIGYKKR
jgi:adenosylcobinamide hydrolase